ncbi:MAG: hypothetical protein GC160_16595 [Acidobacteria bacterium]|nr:hypothetical protein [Acidobacteriota bacterium]
MKAPGLRWLVPLLATGLGLALAEAALRILTPSAPQVELDIYRRDAAGNLRLLPYLDKRHVTPLWDVAVRTNEDGWRDDPGAAADLADSVLGLGDSFAFGWGVEESDSLYRRLEGELGARVLNAAVPGTGTSDQAQLLETVFDSQRPSWTLLALFVGNDFLDVEIGGAGRFEVEDGLLREPGGGPGPVRRAALESRLLQLLRALQFRYGPASAARVPHNWDSWMRAFAQVHRRDAPAELFEGMAAALDRIAAWCDGHDSKLVVVAVPRSWQIDDAELDAMLRGLAMDRSELDLDRPQRFLQDWGLRRNIAVIDLLPAFRAAVAADPSLRLFYTPDSHWTPQGHALAARTAAQELTAVEARR